jgi:hypothetical protein
MAYNTDVMVSRRDTKNCDKSTELTSVSGKMMGFYNGKERTITYLRDLLNQAGWRLIAVYHDTPTAIRYQKAIAVPN